jgi:hypothetical protein
MSEKYLEHTQHLFWCVNGNFSYQFLKAIFDFQARKKNFLFLISVAVRYKKSSIVQLQSAAAEQSNQSFSLLATLFSINFSDVHFDLKEHKFNLLHETILLSTFNELMQILRLFKSS